MDNNTEMEMLKARIKKLEAENEQYKKTIKAHGIKVRHIPIDKEDMVKLFGFRYVNGTVADTTNTDCITNNYNTFTSNLIRVILPYPRGNKCGWVGYKPFTAMSDAEYEVTEEFVKAVIQLAIDAKARIRILEKECSNNE